uniref:Uncharacterized protein n=1 Tax=Ananas comosus var. bracteatus TaxID=296719 RepID=A0A6V7PPA4_ANACO|nr:unnamed protein product [Ananas comosus var. bracteatus]
MGVFTIVAFYITTHAPRASPELRTRGKQVKGRSLKFEDFELGLKLRRGKAFEAQFFGLESSFGLDWKDSNSLLELKRDFLLLRVLRDLWTTPFGETKGSETRHDDWVFETLTTLACHLCSFAHACEGRSLQAGTPELAYATYVRSCGIEKPTGSGGINSFLEWECWSYHRHLGGTSWTTICGS